MKKKIMATKTPYMKYKEKKIFESSCHWKEYCRKHLPDITSHFHLIIAEPWCDEMTGPQKYNRNDFFHKKDWTNSNCATGTNQKIKKGGGWSTNNTEWGACALDGQSVTEWKCIKEVPFKITPAEDKETKDDKWWNKNCKNKHMLWFTQEGTDTLRGAEACVLGDKNDHWGYVQYLWEVAAKSAAKL